MKTRIYATPAVKGLRGHSGRRALLNWLLSAENVLLQVSIIKLKILLLIFNSLNEYHSYLCQCIETEIKSAIVSSESLCLIHQKCDWP